jgi:hypothetical protein
MRPAGDERDCSYARSNNQRLTDVAHAIVADPTTADQLP